MTVETTARFITDLNEAYPRGQDLIHEGDDHIRLMKAVLKNTMPGFTSSITADSDKLNKMDATFEYDTDSVLKVNNALDLTQKQIKNIAAPTDVNDAVNLGFIRGSAMWPVGSIYMTADARNPADIFGFGTWVEFAKGRVIIGSGTNFDENADSKTFANAATGGNYSHQLTTNELPEITPVGTVTVAEVDDHQHDIWYDDGRGGSGGYGTDLRWLSYDNEKDRVWKSTSLPSGKHTHEATVEIEPFGKGEKHSIIQPYIVCNIWQRTV